MRSICEYTNIFCKHTSVEHEYIFFQASPSLVNAGVERSVQVSSLQFSLGKMLISPMKSSRFTEQCSGFFPREKDHATCEKGGEVSLNR